MKRSFLNKLPIPAATLCGLCFAGVVLFASEPKEETSAEKPAVETSAALVEVVSKDIHTLFLGRDDDTHLDKMPPRTILGLDLQRMGWTYNCMECHDHVEDPRFDRDDLEVEHENINLDHGNNRYCLNCHHPENRNAFVDYDGSEISEKHVTLLCAKCHGPKYRDWKAGVHGRQNGFWDSKKGPTSKLRCIQCHDPHSPKFHAIKPLAPPTYPKRAPKKSADNHGHGGSHEH